MSLDKNFDEMTFEKIRKNWITISIIFIFFLLYGSSLKIDSFLIFKIKEIEYFCSAYIDFFVIIFLIWLYVFIRYIIYGLEKINENSPNNNRLCVFIDILTKKGLASVCTDNILIKDAKITDAITSEDKNMRNIYILEEGDKNYIGKRTVTYSLSEAIIGETYAEHIYTKDISKITITDMSVSFNFYSRLKQRQYCIKIEFIEKIRVQWAIKYFFKKEYSDFIWPLFLFFTVLIIGVTKLFYYLF